MILKRVGKINYKFKNPELFNKLLVYHRLTISIFKKLMLKNGQNKLWVEKKVQVTRLETKLEYFLHSRRSSPRNFPLYFTWHSINHLKLVLSLRTSLLQKVHRKNNCLYRYWPNNTKQLYLLVITVMDIYSCSIKHKNIM